jgi:acyl-CoA synthetase (NDP forming)
MGHNTTVQGRLHALFHPSSVALVGATDHSRWSVNTYMNLKQTGFSGRVVCVNPNRPAAHGQPTVPSLRALADPPDLAYVMVGPDHVPDVIDDAAAAGVRSLVLLTAGFRETGPAGAALERELKMRVEHYGLTVLGPNGNGFVNMTAGIAPYGLPLPLPMQAGPVGVVLQSGALASAVLALAQARAVGISLLVSMGNEMQIEATDVIEYLVHDEVTRVIALFLETIRNPVRFAETAQLALARRKPLVVLKTGRSQAGARTAMAHTGALVGDHAVHQAAFRQLGVIEVHSLEDLITTAGLLGYYGPPPGRRMAVVTASGGACDILSDRAEDEGIALPPFGARTEERLRALLPPFSTVQNPLDVTGYVVVDRTLQRRALEVVAQDPGFDFVAAVVEPPRTLQPDADTVRASYRALAQAVKGSPRPVVLMMNAMTDIPPVGREIADETGLHFVGGMEHGMAALGRALWWRERREAWLRRHGIDPGVARLDAPPALWRPCAGGGLLAAQRPAGPSAGPGTVRDTGSERQRGETWSEWQARAYLEQHGVPVVPGCLATSAGEAAAFAAQWCGLWF